MMKKTLLSSALSLCAILAFGQTEVVDVLTNTYKEPVAFSQKTGDTLNLPFRDDFSNYSSFPNPELWTDNKVLVNNTMSANQWSRGFASFDGLDEGGRAYDITKNNSDTLNDVLTSQYLDLSTAVSPYLTFLFQEGGLGDMPERDDSLVVQFWNVDSARWESVWGVTGESSNPLNWRWASVSANSPKWLKNGFRFRLGTYGARNGGFDVWNIDYLSLEEGRTPADTGVSDPSITQPHPYLINNFTQVPWFHMDQASYRGQVEMKYRRNGPVPGGGWQLNLGKFRVLQDGSQIDALTNTAVVSNAPHNVELSYNVPMNPSLINKTPGGPTNVDVLSWYDGEAVGVRRNDTILHRQRFDNVYAFDDGSAERVYGLTDANSYILFRFQPLGLATLKGLQIYFGEAKNDITNVPFKIAIYSFTNNGPGQLMYLSSNDFYPTYVGGRNQFATYELQDTAGIDLNGTVYIGVKQLSSTPLTIGLDKRQDSLTQIIYGDGLNWYPSLQMPSALMIRPFFNYLPSDVSVEEAQAKLEVEVYPNPNTGNFSVRMDAEQAEGKLLDVNGRVIWQGEIHNDERLQIGSVSPGMYILQVQLSDRVAVQKILIQ